VLGRLGEGAKSTIYKVVDPMTKRVLALKHVVRKNDKDIRFVEQMEAEFEMSKGFNHPNLRRCFELKFQKSMLFRVNEAYLVMELIEGKPLDVSLPRSLSAMLDIFLQAAQGLHAMHKAGIIHCDIKPINILVTEGGLVKVIDFGQSCKTGTVKERIQGTPDYIAPEQVARKPVDARTDVFNLGATMYWATTGRTVPTLYTVNKAGDNSLLSHDLIQTPKQLNTTIPENLSKLIMECVATNPTKRPATMEAVIQRLELIKYALLKEEGKITAQSTASSSAVAPDLYEGEMAT
jgi:eukaryotic-like serine/threonine-protein kinase